ncbi:flocculation protein FLO11-like, partial [Drosophila innubila]|uniref:flocculation protein FLO11-like n=1 Tax=Drosophila innubila TaxID=198719 RepID=UPI00148BFAF7
PPGPDRPGPPDHGSNELSPPGPRPPFDRDDPRHSDKETPGYLPPDEPGKIAPKLPSHSIVIEPNYKPPTIKPNYVHKIEKPAPTKSPLTYIPPSFPTVPNHVPVYPNKPITSTITTQPKVPAITINKDRPTPVTTGNINIHKPVPPVQTYTTTRPSPSVPTYRPLTPSGFKPTPTPTPTFKPIYVPDVPTPTKKTTDYYVPPQPKPQPNVTPRPSPPLHVPSLPPSSSETCVCNTDKTHSSKTTTSTTYTTTPTTSNCHNLNPNPASLDFNKQFDGFNGNTHFGSIMNVMSTMSLNQIPVVPQAPGLPAFYPPDKLPKGAVIAFMPVVILPQEYYTNCEENSLHTTANKYQTLDPFPLGVQPAAIPNAFSVHSIFSGQAPRDQCMCPCSCTQNLSNKSYKKRETNAEDAPEIVAEASAPKAVKVALEEDKVAEASTPVEVKVESPVVEEVKAEASTPAEVKVESPEAKVESPVAEVKVESPVAAASSPVEVKVASPAAEVKIAEASAPVETKIEAPVAAASSPVEVKVESPVAEAKIESLVAAASTPVEVKVESPAAVKTDEIKETTSN